MLGQAQEGRKLAEGYGPHAARSVARHLGHGELDVPERDEAEREQPTITRTAPLLHHPVVVRLDAQQGERAVLPPQELLSAESGIVGEAELGLHSVDTHVFQTRLRLPAARPHLVVGDAFQHHLVRREAGGGDGALDGRPVILVAPPGHVGSVGAGSLDVRGALELGHPPGHVLDVRAHIP